MSDARSSRTDTCPVFSRLKEDHAAQVKSVTAWTEDQRHRLTHLDHKMTELQEELAAEKKANNHMGNLVEDQKKQLARREKHIKAGAFCRSTLAAFPSAAVNADADGCCLLVFSGSLQGSAGAAGRDGGHSREEAPCSCCTEKGRPGCAKYG